MIPFKIALLSLALVCPLASAASYDCPKAVSNVEKMVCADPELSRLDDDLHGSYKRAVARVGDELAMRQWQRNWLKSQALNGCKTAQCVKVAYGTRVKLLDDAVPSRWTGQYARYYKGKADRNQGDILLIAVGENAAIVEGMTTWPDPDEQVRPGQFGSLGAFSGEHLIVEAEECQASMTLKGKVLRVDDSKTCSGTNGTFGAEYRRK
ncbi:lysozyme inhibitor LprI family protein [Massilia pseudoviolaceinigra]|uniref:lysozyme inhibitor LprI family protein n=1 Tax=Massilia pseudoviolaceinigra TaxID=3057165 RepID=UPI0027963EA9|nr:hypothetical protein [Massilia sp. CCM 9206]MDQ1921125.1 hypothetical protein [Massilia sp. CCM 9206]